MCSSDLVCQDAIPAPLAALETKPIRHRDVIEVGQMKEVVRQGLEALL